MSTGVPPRDNTIRKKKPVTIVYDGKLELEEILAQSYVAFSIANAINGGNSNNLFFGDNLQALLFMLNNGYKGAIRLIYRSAFCYSIKLCQQKSGTRI
jgi:uncharacterized membrane protein